MPFGICQQRIKLGWFFSWPIFVTKYERRNKHTWTGRKFVYCWIISTLESRSRIFSIPTKDHVCLWIFYHNKQGLEYFWPRFWVIFAMIFSGQFWRLWDVQMLILISVCLFGIQPPISVSTTDTSLYIQFLWIEWDRILGIREFIH